MSNVNYRLRRSEDMKAYLIDSSNPRTGDWISRLQYSLFPVAEAAFIEVLNEEKRMDELNAGRGLTGTPQVAKLEKQVVDLKAEIESMRKLYEE